MFSGNHPRCGSVCSVRTDIDIFSLARELILIFLVLLFLAFF